MITSMSHYLSALFAIMFNSHQDLNFRLHGQIWGKPQPYHWANCCLKFIEIEVNLELPYSKVLCNLPWQQDNYLWVYQQLTSLNHFMMVKKFVFLQSLFLAAVGAQNPCWFFCIKLWLHASSRFMISMLKSL